MSEKATNHFKRSTIKLMFYKNTKLSSRLALSVITSDVSENFVANVKHFPNVLSILVARAAYQVLNI